jgi:hypothetical protein
LLFSFSALKFFAFTATASPLVVPSRKYMPSVIPLQTLATPGLRQVLLVFIMSQTLHTAAPSFITPPTDTLMGGL